MGNKNNNNKYEPIDVTLPYDFIPFVDKSHFPYQNLEELPGHNGDNKNTGEEYLTGCIDYSITPYSDLAIELRQRFDGKHFISGSQIRGKIRSNLEILSASFPRFIDTSPLLYRNFNSDDNNNSDDYNSRMGISRTKGIECSVEAGFLRKIDNKFYVFPAEKIGNKNFYAIKEHRLVQMNLKRKNIYFLFDNDQLFEKINELQNKINKEDREIKKYRENIKEKLNDELQEKISNIFIKEFNFNSTIMKDFFKNSKDSNYIIDDKEIEEVGKKLFNKLKSLVNDDEELLKLCQLTVERWQKKVEMEILYRKLGTKENKNQKYLPYQQMVYFRSNAAGGIEQITTSVESNEELEKGYLFNSTNASSKRSHYLINKPLENHSGFLVPEDVIAGYKRNLKKFKENYETRKKGIKDFYKIFANYDQLIKEPGYENGIIVFYKKDDKISYIGRTPYFKIPYKHQLKQLLKKLLPRTNEGFDYAEALFGFIPGERADWQEVKSKQAYKSRLIFTPLDIEGEVNKDTYKEDEFLLPSPSPSAQGMYLEQNTNYLQTYEGEEPKLNGYKYYHILEQPIVKDDRNNYKKMKSKLQILSKDSVKRIKGKIYFRNITKKELGLILISLDINLLEETKEYKESLQKYAEYLKDSYELIGGAKPYGYGKVKIKLDGINIENKCKDFEQLVLNTSRPVDNIGQYIDEYISSMGGNSYFKRIHLQDYLISKVVITDNEKGKKHYNWSSLQIGGGYPAGNQFWRLKRRISFHNKKD